MNPLPCPRRAVKVLVAFVVIAACAPLHAGPLDPPTGPVTPTSKPLAEVEPRTAINSVNTPGDADSTFRIDQPGSYYLMANVAGEPGRHGIEVAASGVTIDLNGFELLGHAELTSLDGIRMAANGFTNLIIRNGSIRGWRDGLALNGPSPYSGRIEGVNVSANRETGMSVGVSFTVSDCVAYANGGSGISAGIGTTVSDCSALQNGSSGIAGSSCTVQNCVSYGNGGIGIFVTSASVVKNCSANSNFSIGISIGENCVLSGSTARVNVGHGVLAGSTSTISGCAASFNGEDGYRLGGGSIITDCIASANEDDGIQASSRTVIRNNLCDLNDPTGVGAGIHVTGADNRIEGNNCTSNNRGVRVDAAGNVITRNTCSGNATAFEIAANNIYGSIIDRSAVVTAAVSGGSAPGTLATNDANANFTY